MPAISNELKFFANVAFDVALIKSIKETTLSDILYQKEEGWDNTMAIARADYLYLLYSFKHQVSKCAILSFIAAVLMPYLTTIQIDEALVKIKNEIIKSKQEQGK